MLLHSIRLLSFRAHASSEVTFAPKVNLLHGPNGAGKTNVLEAIHYLCLTKSFVTGQDSHVLSRGAPHFEVEGVVETKSRADIKLRLVYVPDGGKRFFMNRASVEPLSHVIGQFPAVVFSPEDHQLTAGAPEERRKLINNVLSQARPVYLDDMMKYRRALKQRNELLYRIRRTGQAVDPGVLASWDEGLILLGARIIKARLDFVSDFGSYLERAFHLLEDIAEMPSMEYNTFEPLEPGTDLEAITERFGARLHRLHRRECQVGRTLAGPHLDELIFRLDTFELRNYGSQGQHRTFGLALKLAQYFYLYERLEEKPLLLLDDVFANLDPVRIRSFLQLLQSDEVGQTFITGADLRTFDTPMEFDGETNRAIHIVSGQVLPNGSL